MTDPEMSLGGSFFWARTSIFRSALDGEIKRVWKESVPNKMTEFMRFTLGRDQVLSLVSGEILQCQIYDTTGTKIASGSRGLITGLAKGENLPKEITKFYFPCHLRYRLRIVLPSDMPFLIFGPGASVIFNVLSTSTIPATPHPDTLFSYHAYLLNDSYSRYRELKAKGLLPSPGVYMSREGVISGVKEGTRSDHIKRIEDRLLRQERKRIEEKRLLDDMRREERERMRGIKDKTLLEGIRKEEIKRRTALMEKRLLERLE